MLVRMDSWNSMHVKVALLWKAGSTKQWQSGHLGSPLYACIHWLSSLSTSNRKGMRVNGEALQLYTVYKEDIFYYRSCKNLYQVLWVVCTSKPAMKLKVHMIKIIITIVPRYTGTKHITRLLPLALLLRVRTYSNTDSNRLIFSRLGSMMILVICIALILHIWPWRSFLVSFEKTYLEAFFQLLILCHTKVRRQ